MKQRIILGLLLVSTIFVISCEDTVGGETPQQLGAYVIAASSGEAAYLLQTDAFNNSNLTIEGSGLETETGTFVFHGTKYLYRLVYNQGNAGTGSSYLLDETGKIKERGVKFEITNRFTTYGPYGQYFITAAAGATSRSDNDENIQQGVTFTILDTEAQTLKTKTISTEDFLGNGEYTTFSGIVDVNGKLFTAVCPVGVSAYGVAQGVAQETRTTTNYVDNVWVAIYNGVDFENPKIITDDRLSYASSRYRSQYYSNIVSDDKNNVYVFSSAYDSRTTKKSGVLMIKSGTEVFDKDYYFDIEAASGGIHMFKVWHIGGDHFLLQMYTTEEIVMDAAKKLAVFNAASKSFKWITDGFPEPELIGSIGSTPLADNGKMYIPIVPTDGGQPAIYEIDPLSATAAKRLTVTSQSISAIGKLTN